MLGCGIVTAYAVKIFIAIYIWKLYYFLLISRDY